MSHFSTAKYQSPAFTLLELILVVSITAIIAAAILTQTGRTETRLALDRSAQTISSRLRGAQNDALGGKKVDGVIPLGGFGVYAQEQTSSIILFADKNNNHLYDGATEKLEEVSFAYDDVKVEEVGYNGCGGGCTEMVVAFVPPVPDVFIYGDPGDLKTLAQDFVIILGRGAERKTIHINEIGAIWTE